jgi:two-component system, NarL family, response regulator DevR
MGPQLTSPLRLLLIDGHDMVRTGLRQYIGARNIRIVGECADVAEGVSEARRLLPDVVLMEMQFPGSPNGSGLQACREIRTACPAIRVVFLSSHNDEEAKLSSILAGADAYLLKDIGATALMDTIETVASGRPVLDAAVLKALLRRIQAVSITPAGKRTLSPQERKILPLVAAGKTNKEIGVELGLSHKTVKNYLSNVYQKLQVRRRSQVAAMFARNRD